MVRKAIEQFVDTRDYKRELIAAPYQAALTGRELISSEAMDVRVDSLGKRKRVAAVRAGYICEMKFRVFAAVAAGVFVLAVLPDSASAQRIFDGTAKSGELSVLGTYYSPTVSGCNPRPVQPAVAVIKQGRNGKLSYSRSIVSRYGDSYPCGRQVNSATVFTYRSRPDFKGSDSVEYKVKTGEVRKKFEHFVVSIVVK